MKYADALKFAKRKRPRKHVEDDECAALWAWFLAHRRLGVLAWHVPNGGRRGAREGGRLKRMGVVPGVADYHFLDSRGRFFAMEYKTEYGRATAEQMEFVSQVNASPCCYACICYGLTQAKKTMQTWGLIE